MYPLLLHAPSKQKLWGGNKLFDMFPENEYENASEMWMLSASPEGESTVKNRELKDMVLSQVFEKYGKRFCGEKYNPELPFPLFIRLIDAKDSLPLGVSTREKILYIVDAENDSQLIYGFSRNTDIHEIKQRAGTNTMFSVCNYVSVKKGDTVNIPAGCLHAIGKGILCYEIQHGDEDFYPVSDYGRTDKNGNHLPLKINEALGIMRYGKAESTAARLEDTFLYPFGTVSELPSNEDLSVSLIRLAGSVGISETESFVSAIITDGDAILSYPSGTIHLKSGDSILIPAKTNVKFTGYADILCSHI